MHKNPKQKFKARFKKILSIMFLGVFMLNATALAQDEGGETETLYEPVEKQIIQLTDEGSQADWNISQLETFGLKFLIRGKEALTWSLNIEDGGFHNPAIEESYATVLTIVNSLFILGLLAIAAMWMFSIIVPRKYLKKVILIYSLAVIFVNFALPVNQLLVDGSNLLQKTLLVGSEGNISITNIVQTPTYEEAISYKNETPESLINGKQSSRLSLNLQSPEADINLGKVTKADETSDVISIDNQKISILAEKPFSIYQEQNIFRFTMIMATAIAYFLIALVFILRIVILWALLILSPILLLLVIFKSTRGWFFNWLGLYGRWLLIGPLTALGIALVVNIWQLSGLPISVSDSYTAEVFSQVKDSNMVFYLPGKDTPNTLSNSNEMMEYIIFLIMLYLPIFLAFFLTRQKIVQEGAMAISRTINKNRQNNQSQIIQGGYTQQEASTKESGQGFISNISKLVNEKIGLISEAAMPLHKIKSEPSKPTQMMPSASNFLSENLMQTPVPKILELLGQEKGSKSSHKRVIEKLTHIKDIKDHKEREKFTLAKEEIERRGEENDKDSTAILHEIQTFAEKDFPFSTNENSPQSSANASNIQININEEKKNDNSDKKVRDRSFNEKNGDKNVKKETEDKNKSEEDNTSLNQDNESEK